MKKGSSEKGWGAYDITRRQAAGLALAVFAVLFAVAGRDIEDNTSRPFELIVRRLFHKTPPLDPRIKILITPDRGHAEPLTGDEWRRSFELLAKAKPKAILVAHVFGAHYAPETAAGLERAIRAAGNVIAVGSPVSEFVETDHVMSLDRPDYDLRLLMGRPHLPMERLRNQTSWLPRGQFKFFGPDEEIAGAFSHIGQLTFEGPTLARYVKPFVRVDAGHAIPYFALFAAESLAVEKNAIVVNGKRVHFDRYGRLPVNFSSLDAYSSASRYLVDYLSGARDIREDIKEGDYVVILSAKAALPVGKFPVKQRLQRIDIRDGACVPAAILNSVLTGKWLTPVGGRAAMMLLACFLGTLIGMTFHGRAFVIAVGSAVFAATAVGVGAFNRLDVVLPWFFPTVGLTSCALGVFLLRTLVRDLTARRLRRLLLGTVPADLIDEIVRNPGQLQLGAAEQVLTIMFVDIMGFSKAAEKREPREVFSSLRELIEDITRTVHAFGGVVDRTLGDGMLCVFGYTYGLRPTSPDHADQAVECAIRIQSDQVRRAIEARRDGRAVNPLRIGINTTALYIGDLGGENRIDITVIGDGVNYAQRLEAACEGYRVMIGAPTRAALTRVSPALASIRNKLLNIKHHSEAIEAFEVDPFADDPDALEQALSAFRDHFGARREADRWDVPEGTVLTVETDFGRAALVNFSRGGLGLVLDHYLSRGMHVTLSLDRSHPTVAAALRRWGLHQLVGEVRWARPAGDKFAHGVRLLNLSAEQQETLVKALLTSLSGELPRTGT